MSYQVDNFKKIADKIREKTNSDKPIKPLDFSTKIDDVYNSGKKSAYDEFWDTFQDYGKRTDYSNGFCGLGFNEETFKPKYDIIAYDWCYMPFAKIDVKSLKNVEKQQNIKIDFSHATVAQYLFYKSNIEEIGIVDLSSAKLPLNTIFNYATNITTIDLLKLKNDGKQSFSSESFYRCYKLKNIKIQGTIGTSIDFHYSVLLSYDSLKSIINALKSNASNTLTIGNDNITKLTDEDIAFAVSKGWTIV